MRHVGRRGPALRDLALRWEQGERLLLLGPSGSGKSTLALCLNGVIPHAVEVHWEAGRVVVDGRDTRSTALADTTRTVGVVFQDPETQMVMLEIEDEIAFGLENRALPRAEMTSRIRAVRSLLGLDTDRTPERLDQLSGGTKQRVAIAAVMAAAPAGLVLDEPTANLDPLGARVVNDTLARVAADRRRSLLVIEHRLDEIIPLIDRVAVLDEGGGLALEGPPHTIFGPHAPILDALGVWVPQLTRLGRAVGASTPPRTVEEAADVLVERLPRSLPDPTRRTASGGRALLAARGVTYRYGSAAPAALQNVSATIGAGELVAVVGRNAAGKSTLGLLLAGALTPTTGAVELDGRDLRATDPTEVRARIAYVFQYPEHQFVARTAREEVAFGLGVRGLAADSARRRADEELDRVGLAALALAEPHTLSHGQKRRLSVATALATDPEALILDEPTFGQDRRHSEALLSLLAELNRQGRTIVVITHDLALVADHAERVLAMTDGRVLLDGTPAELFGRPDVLSACGLEPPPVARACQAARRQRADIPPIIGSAALERSLSHLRR